MKTKHKLSLTEDAIRVILIILGSVFSMVISIFTIFAIIKIQENDLTSAAFHLFVVFVVLGLSRLVTWIKDRTKISLIRFIILFVADVLLGVLVFFARDNLYFYSLCGGLFCLTVIVSRIFKIIQHHDKRSIILNSIIIAIFTLLAVGLFLPFEGDFAYAPIIVVCFIVAFTALIEVLSNAFSTLKFKTLFQIIFRTFALEIILGLVTMIIACSLVFMFFEDSINSFTDGLWYSFAVVTTIGFGDFTAVTPVGRIATVLLGIYGIIVVAVITSIVVNFYNESAGKRDSRKLKEIKNENE